MNYDLVNNADVAGIADRTFDLLNRLDIKRMQHKQPVEKDLLAAACLLQAMAAGHGADIGRLLTAAGRLMNHADGTYVPEFRAIRRYMRMEK